MKPRNGLRIAIERMNRISNQTIWNTSQSVRNRIIPKVHTDPAQKVGKALGLGGGGGRDGTTL